MEWGWTWVFGSSAGKTQLVSVNQPNITSATDVKMDVSALEEKSSFQILGLYFSSKLDLGSCIISIAKTSTKKNEALIRSMKFLSPEVALQTINLPYSLAWNTVVMPGLVLLAAT